MFSDDNTNVNLLMLSEKKGNEICADCKRKDWEDLKVQKKNKWFDKEKKKSVVEVPTRVTTWMNKKLGVFLCSDCALIHQELPDELKENIIIADNKFDPEALNKANEMGNEKANSIYEASLPHYVILPSSSLINHMNIYRKKFIFDKYVEKIYTKEFEKEYTNRMPELIYESDTSVLKGKTNWEKRFLVHHHMWLSLFKGPKDSVPIMKIDVTDINEITPIYFESKDKELKTFSISYNVTKDNETKVKTKVFLESTFEKLDAMVISIRKAMIFYSDEKKRPKKFTGSTVKKIATLQIRNSLVKGELHKRSKNGKNWHKRYFALIGPTLYTLKNQDDNVPLSLIPLQNTEIKRRGPLLVERRHSFAIVGENETVFFAAKDDDELEDWTEKLKEIQKEHPNRPMFNFCQPLVKEENAAKKSVAE